MNQYKSEVQSLLGFGNDPVPFLFVLSFRQLWCIELIKLNYRILT